MYILNISLYPICHFQSKNWEHFIYSVTIMYTTNWIYHRLLTKKLNIHPQTCLCKIVITEVKAQTKNPWLKVRHCIYIHGVMKVHHLEHPSNWCFIHWLNSHYSSITFVCACGQTPTKRDTFETWSGSGRVRGEGGTYSISGYAKLNSRVFRYCSATNQLLGRPNFSTFLQQIYRE